MRVLVTGGAGYIGSHTCVSLLEAGFDVGVVDNLSNSKYESLRRVSEITGKPLRFYEVNLLDKEALSRVFDEEKPEMVIHFAGLKAVGESVAMPLRYYENNIMGTINLCNEMSKHNVKKLIFSSSATVYGDPHAVPITEDFPLHTTNPYGSTKLMIERILGDLHTSDPDWSVVLLRYFNPVGAHESGKIGEDPKGIPNNIIPFITQTAAGRHEALRVFGNDYPTKDGTGVRDYLHVVDLAEGHVAAIKKLDTAGVHIYNLGTGRGTSVLELVEAFEKATGIHIPYNIHPRRPGDIAECYAACDKAATELSWTAKRDIIKMMEDSWRWQKSNPQGYDGSEA